MLKYKVKVPTTHNVVLDGKEAMATGWIVERVAETMTAEDRAEYEANGKVVEEFNDDPPDVEMIAISRSDLEAIAAEAGVEVSEEMTVDALKEACATKVAQVKLEKVGG